MKVIIQKLQGIANELEGQIASREETFSLRTDKWKDSEKGEEYNEKTEFFTEIKDQVQEWIEKLETDSL